MLFFMVCIFKKVVVVGDIADLFHPHCYIVGEVGVGINRTGNLCHSKDRVGELPGTDIVAVSYTHLTLPTILRV